MGLLEAGIMLLMGFPFVVTPLLALRKGYAPYYWLLSCGPIGLAVMAYLPALKVAKTPEEYERFEARANFIGAVLSGLAIFITTVPMVIILSIWSF